MIIFVRWLEKEDGELFLHGLEIRPSWRLKSSRPQKSAEELCYTVTRGLVNFRAVCLGAGGCSPPWLLQMICLRIQLLASRCSRHGDDRTDETATGGSGRMR